MSTNITNIVYRGLSLTREVVITFDASMKDGDPLVTAWVPVPPPEREIRITLPQGQHVSDEFKRGRPVDLTAQGVPFKGRVKYRRLNRVVFIGRFST